MVLAWVSERLAVAMRQAEDEDNVLDKFNLIDLDTLKRATRDKENNEFKRIQL
jgi:hypothetical protein